jgi:hypothetical protein
MFSLFALIQQKRVHLEKATASKRKRELLCGVFISSILASESESWRK